VATTLQQLLDSLTEQTAAQPLTATIEDVTGALAHLGRALTGLSEDGLTAEDSARQQTTTDLGAACSSVGRLWPRTGGPLTDLAGAAADLVGRDRTIKGRAHRWAATVSLAEAADHCARLGNTLLPQAATAELGDVRRLAAAVERDALLDPPTAFRAAVAAAEITSRSAVAVMAVAADREPGPLLVTAVAWQLAGRASMAFDDGRRAGTADARCVVVWAQELAGALQADVRAYADSSTSHERSDLLRLADSVGKVASQLPVLAEELTAAVDGWARSGRLYVPARLLPPVESMPEDRVRAVIAGRPVRAFGDDLHPLRRIVGRAGELSAGLSDAINRAYTAGAPAERHLADFHARRVHAPDAGERLLGPAQAVERAASPPNVIPLFGRCRSPESPPR
jgi:hypothetical protein